LAASCCSTFSTSHRPDLSASGHRNRRELFCRYEFFFGRFEAIANHASHGSLVATTVSVSTGRRLFDALRIDLAWLLLVSFYVRKKFSR
jgi:hypothetical protein